MFAPAHLLLPALTDTTLPEHVGEPDAGPEPVDAGPEPVPEPAPCVFSAEGTCAETPLTSEPPLTDAEPLTSEPPLAETAHLTSETAAEPAGPGAGGAELE